jgi:hypothetical protein
MGIEQKLIVDRFLEFTMPTIASPPIPADKFFNQNRIDLTITESTGDSQKQSSIVEGTGKKVHRNFQWLAWVPGAISAVQTGGDVLTGPMSGCWVVVFQRNGIEYVGHIGTSMTPTDPQSIAVKTAWYTFARSAGPGNAVIAGFNPGRAWPAGASLPAQKPGDGNAVTFGLVTTNKELYAVLMYKGNASVNVTVIPPGQRASNIFRIAEIKNIKSENTDRLKGIFPPYLPELELPGPLQMP